MSNPLNPNNLWTVSPTQLHMWEYCPQEWHLTYQEDLSLLNKVKRKFDFGLYSHELMHVYYQLLKLGSHRPGSDFLIKAMQSRVKNDLTGENIQLLADVWPRILNYLKNQSPKIDAGMKVLEVEYEVMVEVETPKGLKIMLHGILDLLYRDSAGKIRIRDHKTTGYPKSHTQDALKLNNQLLFYAVMMSELLPVDVLDVEINSINSTIWKTKNPPPDELFKLVRWQHTPAGLAIAKENILKKIDMMFDSEPWKNYGPSCANCQMFGICSTEMRGLSTHRLIQQLYERGTRSARAKPISTNTINQEHSRDNKEFTISITGV